MRVFNQKAGIDWKTSTLEDALAALRGLPGDLSVDNLVCISQKCRKSRDLKKALEFLEYVRRNGLEAEKSLGTYLVPMLVECGSISGAQEVFDRLTYQNVHAWTSLISGYARGGSFRCAWNIYRRMQESNVAVNSYTLIALLKASFKLKDVQETHLEVAEKSFENDLYVGSALVDSYVKCGALLEAREVFNQLSVQSVVSWTTLIAGYTDNGFSKVALRCYDQMQKQGLSPNEVTLICILKACANLRALLKGQEIHLKIVLEGYQNPLIGSTLVDMYAKCGAHLEADCVVKKLPGEDVVPWNALIAGYVEYELGQEALACFKEMQDVNVCADAFTVVCVLRACGDTGASDIGFDVHTEIIFKSFESDLFVANTLIDMYGKCRLLIEAQKLFDGMKNKDLVSWNAILRAYSANYDVEKTLQLFESMQEHHLKLDSITFTSVLDACSHVNCADRALELFKMMTTKHGIIPTIDHFTCLVDLLARSGKLHEAERLLETMVSVRSKEMWLALLSACKSCSELEVGFRCFRRLLKIDSKCSTPYLLMARMYANAGKWQDACRIRALQRETLPAEEDLSVYSM